MVYLEKKWGILVFLVKKFHKKFNIIYNTGYDETMARENYLCS